MSQAYASAISIHVYATWRKDSAAYPRYPPSLRVAMVAVVHSIAAKIICEYAVRDGMWWYGGAIRRKAAEYTAGRIGEGRGAEVMDTVRGVVVHVVHGYGVNMQGPEAAVKATGCDSARVVVGVRGV
jgi:hypothetical protein